MSQFGQVGKLFAVASIGRSIYGRWVFQRLLAGAIVIAGLTIITSMLVSAMLIGGFYAAYLALLHYGMEHDSALLVTGMLALLTTALIAAIAGLWFQNLRGLPQRMFKHKSPLASKAGETIDAFFDGFFSE